MRRSAISKRRALERFRGMRAWTRFDRLQRRAYRFDHIRGLYYVLKNGRVKAVRDLRKWSICFECFDRQIVRTTLGPNQFVSTVFLGMDHGFGEGDPVLWETMIFFAGTPMDQNMWRYCTEDEARAGHDNAVQIVRDWMLKQ